MKELMDWAPSKFQPFQKIPLRKLKHWEKIFVNVYIYSSKIQKNKPKKSVVFIKGPNWNQCNYPTIE